MMSPTFFIVGAQKAGTTSLHAMLARHEQVFMSDPKEPGYFIRGFDDPERWQTLYRPDKHGRIQPLSEVDLGVFNADDYAALFSSAEAQRAQQRGEASTPYLPSPHAADRIKATVPGAKIIIALRDPVPRAYSAWGYNSSRGRESAASFEQAIAEELAGKRDHFIYGWRYLYSGLFSRHVERYLDRFGRENVLLLSFDKLKEDGQGVFDTMCDFLEVSRQTVNAGRQENVTVRHANPVIEGIRNSFNRPGAIKSLIKPFLPRGLRTKVRRGVTTSLDRYGERPEPMTQSVRQELSQYYAGDLAKLAEMVDFDISHWGKAQSGPGGETHG